MNKTEATYLNTVLRWMTGAPEISTEDAYWCAAQLAERSRKVMSAGVGRGEVEAGGHRANSPHAYAALLALCWQQANRNGSWPGAEIVPLVDGVLTGHGYDTTHPGYRPGAVLPPSGTWELADLIDAARADPEGDS